jgi:hypothetical protein
MHCVHLAVCGFRAPSIAAQTTSVKVREDTRSTSCTLLLHVHASYVRSVIYGLIHVDKLKELVYLCLCKHTSLRIYLIVSYYYTYVYIHTCTYIYCTVYVYMYVVYSLVPTICEMRYAHKFMYMYET